MRHYRTLSCRPCSVSKINWHQVGYILLDVVNNTPVTDKTTANFINLKQDSSGWSLDQQKHRVIKRSLQNNLTGSRQSREQLRKVQLIKNECIFQSVDCKF